MQRPRIFILGISGFIGSQLAYRLRKKYSIYGGYFSHPIYFPDTHTYPINLNNKDLLERLLSMLRPDFCIMAAGLTDVKLCTEYPTAAESINSLLPLAFATAANRIRSKNIHISCAEVFDGEDKSYDENYKNFSTANYGKSKATAENYIRAQTLENTILRVGRVLGPASSPFRPTNFDRLRISLAEKKIFYANDLRTYSYISINNFVKAIELILENEIPATQRVLHLGGYDANEFEMTQKIATTMKQNPALIRAVGAPAKSDDQASPIMLTKNFTLNCSLFAKTYKWQAEDDKTLIQNVLSEFKTVNT